MAKRIIVSAKRGSRRQLITRDLTITVPVTPRQVRWGRPDIPRAHSARAGCKLPYRSPQCLYIQRSSRAGEAGQIVYDGQLIIRAVGGVCVTAGATSECRSAAQDERAKRFTSRTFTERSRRPCGAGGIKGSTIANDRLFASATLADSAGVLIDRLIYGHGD
jgi:hypothetical protein